MSRLVTLLTCAALAFASADRIEASAGYGRSDVVPAATLLLPYFEVDIGDASGDGMADCTGVNTIFSINNASAAPALAHVTLWSDWSVPTLDFDIYLTGYDVQTLNLCEVFGWGNLPITADEARDPGDSISPHGGEFADNPDWDASFPACDQIFPFGEGLLQGFYLDRIQNAHGGYPVPGFDGECMGASLNGGGQCADGSCPGGTVARGYITVDQVNQCSLLFAGDPGYFVNGGQGVAGNANVLWGDYFIIDPANNFAQGEPLVHIEANGLLDAFNVPVMNPGTGATVTTVTNETNYTFYGRYSYLSAGADNREPLGTVWGARYLNGIVGETSWSVWRDSTQALASHVVSYPCTEGPDWFPMNETEVVCFNESEDAVELCFFSMASVSPPLFEDPACFPLETGRYTVGTGDLALPFDHGWCYLNLNPGIDGFPGDIDFGPSGDMGSSYVTAFHSAQGRFSVGLSAVQLSSGLRPPPANITWSNDIPQAPRN